MNYADVIELLGSKGKDKITKQDGVISSVSFDLYGCIQVILTPLKVKNGEEIKSHGWFDINRIEVSKDKKIMKHPCFENKYKSLNDVGGAAEKPFPTQGV